MEFKVFIRHRIVAKDGAHLAPYQDAETHHEGNKNLQVETSFANSSAAETANGTSPNSAVKAKAAAPIVPTTPSFVVSPHNFNIDEIKPQTPCDETTPAGTEASGTKPVPDETDGTDSTGTVKFVDPKPAAAREGTKFKSVKKLAYDKIRSFHAFSGRRTPENRAQTPEEEDVDKLLQGSSNGKDSDDTKTKLLRSINESYMELGQYQFDGVSPSACNQQGFFEFVMFSPDDIFGGCSTTPNSSNGHAGPVDEAYICFGDSGSGKTYTLFGELSADGCKDASQHYGIVPRLVMNVFSAHSRPEHAEAKLEIRLSALLLHERESIRPIHGDDSEDETGILIDSMHTLTDCLKQVLHHPQLANSHVLVTVYFRHVGTGGVVERRFNFVEMKSSVIRTARTMLPLIPSLRASKTVSGLEDADGVSTPTPLRQPAPLSPHVKSRSESQLQLADMHLRVERLLTEWLEDADPAEETDDPSHLHHLLLDCFHGKCKTAMIGVLARSENWLEEAICNDNDDDDASKPDNLTIDMAIAIKESVDVLAMTHLLLTRTEESDETVAPIAWDADSVPKTFTPSYLQPPPELYSVRDLPKLASPRESNNGVTSDATSHDTASSGSTSGESGEEGGNFDSIRAFKAVVNTKLTEIFQSEEYYSRCLNAEKACEDLEREKEMLLIKLRTAENELRLISEVWRSPNSSFVAGGLPVMVPSSSVDKKLDEAAMDIRVIQIDQNNLDDLLDPFPALAAARSGVGSGLQVEFDKEHETHKKREVNQSPLQPGRVGSKDSGSNSNSAASTASAQKKNLLELPSMYLSKDPLDDFPTADEEDEDEGFNMPEVDYFIPPVFDSTDPLSPKPVDRHRKPGSFDSGSSLTTRSTRSEPQLFHNHNNGSYNWAVSMDSSVADHIRTMKAQYKEINALIDRKLEQVRVSEAQRAEIERTRQVLKSERTEKERVEQSYLEMMQQYERLKSENERIRQEKEESEARIRLLEEEREKAQAEAEAAEREKADQVEKIRASSALLGVLSGGSAQNRGPGGHVSIVLPDNQPTWHDMFDLSKSAEGDIVYRSDDDEEDFDESEEDLSPNQKHGGSHNNSNNSMNGQGKPQQNVHHQPIGAGQQHRHNRSSGRISRKNSDSTDENAMNFDGDDSEDDSDNGDFVRSSPSVLAVSVSQSVIPIFVNYY
jgi:hypothetical protein